MPSKLLRKFNLIGAPWALWLGDAYLYGFYKSVPLAADVVIKYDVVLVFFGELLYPFQKTLVVSLLYFNILQRFLPHGILHDTSECIVKNVVRTDCMHDILLQHLEDVCIELIRILQNAWLQTHPWEGQQWPFEMQDVIGVLPALSGRSLNVQLYGLLESTSPFLSPILAPVSSRSVIFWEEKFDHKLKILRELSLN